MKFLAATAVMAGLVVAGSASAATNLIANGSFEDPTLSGWTLASAGSGTGYSPTVIIKTDNVARPYPTGAFGEAIPQDTAGGLDPDVAGLYGAYFSSDVGTETLSQTVDLAAGKYNISLNAYIPFNGYSNPNDATFTATVGGFMWDSVQLKQTAGAPGVWTHYQGVVTVGPGGGATTFAFAADGFPAVDVVIDKVFATAVPEPASWALMIMGFGFAGAALRRRQTATA
jgi:PEP-CTERM motif